MKKSAKFKRGLRIGRQILREYQDGTLTKEEFDDGLLIFGEPGDRESDDFHDGLDAGTKGLWCEECGEPE